MFLFFLGTLCCLTPILSPTHCRPERTRVPPDCVSMLFDFSTIVLYCRLLLPDFPSQSSILSVTCFPTKPPCVLNQEPVERNRIFFGTILGWPTRSVYTPQNECQSQHPGVPFKKLSNDILLEFWQKNLSEGIALKLLYEPLCS